MKAKISSIYWKIAAILVLMVRILNAQSLHFDAPIDSSLTYFEDEFLTIPYSTGTVNITDSSSVAVYSSKSITFQSGFTADSHDGSSFFAMTYFGPCNNNRVCQFIDNSNFDFLAAPGTPPQALTPPAGPPVLRACPWTSVRGTADYFHRLGGFQNRIPNNIFGSATDHSGTGNAYAGVISYAYNLPNTPPINSEFLAQPLNSVLPPQQYYAEFYFQHSSKSKYAVDQIGMYLAQWPMIPRSTTIPIIQSSGILLDGSGWQRISGCFTPSNNMLWVMFGTSITNQTLVNNSPAFVDEAYYYIDDPAIVPFKVDAGPDVSVCSNENVEIGKANCLSSLNSTGITYNWIKLTGPLGSGLDNPNIYNPNFSLSNPFVYPITQIYQVTATTETGCTTSDFVQITIYPKFNPTVTFETLPANCNGACSGTAEVIVNGGIGNYSYLWSPNSETTPAITGLCFGNYSVLISDANGCTSTGSVDVLPNDLLADAGSSMTVCRTSTGTTNIILGGMPVGSGGSEPFSYVWWPSTGLNSTTIEHPTATNLSSSTTYTVTITDAIGCTISDQVLINVQSGSGPVANAGPDVSVHEPISCGVNNAILGAPAVTGCQYVWTTSNLDVYASLFSPNMAQPILSYPVAWIGNQQTPIESLLLTVIDQNNCISNDIVIANFPACRRGAWNDGSGENDSIIDDIHIYPNPTNKNLYIELPIGKYEMVEIYNTLGKKVIQKGIDSQTETIELDLSNLSFGIYNCLITGSTNEIRSQKVMVVK